MIGHVWPRSEHGISNPSDLVVSCSFDGLRGTLEVCSLKSFWIMIKGSLEEKLPSYEKLRSACVQVRDAKRSRLTVARVGTLGAAHVRRGCGAGAAAAPVEIEA